MRQFDDEKLNTNEGDWIDDFYCFSQRRRERKGGIR
jgi:hypothetical protein